ncbi:MAG: hydroxymethylglutaryl-CoA synthase family protein [Candidatus Lokiarchaeota archaeon]|nr:hydroxymethylglutaryl-CoA synthase family protein [Candidatus Lokiarchaeota archaeon]
MDSIGIVRYGAYMPKYLLDRKKIAEAWDFPSIPGGISVSNSDEDTITMAVEAGLDCLGELNPSGVDGLYFATTTPPYTEKQNATVIANALDLRNDIITMDITDSTRGSSIAVARAYETIQSGNANLILVIAADTQKPMPESMFEYQYGDGAAALLIGNKDVVLSILGYASTADNVIGPWKRATDEYIRQFEGKHEGLYGYSRNMLAAFKALFKKLEIDPSTVRKAALYATDPRMASSIGKKIGFKSKAIEGVPFLEFGNTGNAFALMTFMLAIKRARTDDLIAFGNYGDGADAILFKVLDKTALLELRKFSHGIVGYKNTMIPLKSYPAYIAKKKLLTTDRYTRKASPVRSWRDEKFLYRLYGMKCKNCGIVQYPIQRACFECGAKDNNEEIKMQRTGKIFTYTLDHLVGGVYYDTPTPRCVIDLDGGGRILCDMTDVENPEEVVHIGMDVELCFRFMHPGANFNNYYWKCKPIRFPNITEEDEE